MPDNLFQLAMLSFVAGCLGVTLIIHRALREELQESADAIVLRTKTRFFDGFHASCHDVTEQMMSVWRESKTTFLSMIVALVILGWFIFLISMLPSMVLRKINLN